MTTIGLHGARAARTGVATVLRSPNGSYEASVSNSGLFTAPGLLDNFGIYNVESNSTGYNLLRGTDSTNAAANATALTGLWNAIAAAGKGGIIFFPPGDWPCNAVTLNHAQSTGKSISIWGCGGATILKFYGASGPYLTIASNSNSPVQMCGIKDIWINHGAVPSGGATIRLGYTSRYIMENVILFGGEARIAVQLIASASVHMKSCTLTVQDSTSAICLDIATTVSTGGVQLTSCDLSGVYPKTRGIALNNTALMDTIVLNGVSLKDHLIGFTSQFGTGNVVNVQMNGGYTDGCDYGVILAPQTGATYGSFDFSNVWMYGAKQNLILSEINGGTLSSVSATGGVMPGATEGPIELIGAVTDVNITGVRCGGGETNTGGYGGIKLSDDGSGNVPNIVTISGNTIKVGASADACIVAPAGTTTFTIVGNTLVGGADSDGLALTGGTGTARVAANNSYTA